MKKAIAYLRVSSEEQVNNFSLSNQEDYCRNYSALQELEIIEIFRDEGKSAATAERPELIRLLEYCRKSKGKITHLIVYRLDRLSRNTIDYLDIKRRLQDYGVVIKSATEFTDNTPMGEFIETLIAAQAKLDNAIRAERARDGIKKRVQAGYPVSVPPIGYRLEHIGQDHRVPIRDEPNFSILKDAGHLYLTGSYSFQEIAKHLNESGIKTKSGKKVGSNFVGKFIRNPFYKGVIKFKKTENIYEGKHDAMFTDHEWDKLQKLAASKPLGKPKSYRKDDFPLRVLVKCAISNTSFTGSWCKGKTKHYPYYYPITKGKTVHKDVLESEFKSLLDEIRPLRSSVNALLFLTKGKYLKLNKNENLKFENAKFEYEISRLYQNPRTLWEKLSFERKTELQKIIFPENLYYQYPGFKTPTLSTLFRFKQGGVDNASHLLVRVEGIDHRFSLASSPVDPASPAKRGPASDPLPIT